MEGVAGVMYEEEEQMVTTAFFLVYAGYALNFLKYFMVVNATRNNLEAVLWAGEIISNYGWCSS